MKTRRLSLGALFVSSIALGLASCGDDDSSNTTPDAAVDSGASGTGGGGSGGNTNKPGKDAGTPFDAGDQTNPVLKPVKFKVPNNGGTTKVTLADGKELAFTFPSSAAGKMITLTPTSAASIGWPQDQFSAVIRMEPDGLKFDDPVIVQPSKGEMLLATFAESKDRRAGEMLELAKDQTSDKIEGLALHHFTLLGIIAAKFSCDDHNGWKATPNSQRCTNTGAATTYLEFACDASPLCWTITGHCCAAPGSIECHYTDPLATLSFTWQGPLGGTFPWCGPAMTMDAGHDAGQDASTIDEDAGTTSGSGGTNGGTGGTQGGTGGTQGGTGGTQGGTGGTQGGTGGTQGGTGGTQGGTGGTQGGTGGTQGGTGGTQGGTGGTQGGTGGTQGGTGGTQGGTGGTGGGSGVTCDQAGTWSSPDAVPSAEQLFGVWGASDTDVWAVGNATGAGALIGHYDGQSWTSQQPAALTAQGNAFRAVWGADATHVFAVGSGGSIYTNTGGTWHALANPASPTSAELYGIWGMDANNYWVVGASGAVWQYSAGAWHDYSIATSVNDSIGTLTGVWGTAPGDIWVTNYTGVSSATDFVIHHFYSSAWHTDASSNSSYYWNAIWGMSNSDVWAVGYSKGASAHYAGSTWMGSTAQPTNNNLNSIWGRTTNTVWTVGDIGKIEYWDGANWTSCSPHTQLGLNAVRGTTTKVWAVGNGGTVLRNDPPLYP